MVYSTYRPRLHDIHCSAKCFLSCTVRLLDSPVVPFTNTEQMRLANEKVTWFGFNTATSTQEIGAYNRLKLFELFPWKDA